MYKGIENNSHLIVVTRMEQSSLNPLARQVVVISRSDRWQAYQRLKSLEVPCWCEKQGCLQVEVNSPLAAIQLWSVMQQFSGSRQQLITWLHRCWQQKG